MFIVKLVNLLFSVCFATGYIHSGEIKIFIILRQLSGDCKYHIESDRNAKQLHLRMLYTRDDHRNDGIPSGNANPMWWE